MYPSDFNGAETALSPIDEPVFLGVPPLMALFLIMLVLAVAVVAFMMGRRGAERAGGTDADRAPEDIHRAIHAASTAALAAPSDELRTRAKALRAAIDDHLGPVLEVSKGVTGPLRALDEALKGEIKEPAKAEDKTPEPNRPPPAPIQAVSPPVTVNQIFVGPHPHPHPDRPEPRPEPKPETRPEPRPETKPETRPMTGPEQIDALSRAIRAFHDHWSRRPERIRELKAARAALSRRPPASKTRAHH